MIISLEGLEAVSLNNMLLTKLKEFESSRQTTKIVIGIHTHVYDEIRKNFILNFLQQKSITVEMNKISEAETLLIFKEQLKRGHCKLDSNCWFYCVGFQPVLDKLSKNQSNIGGPFLSLMYCNQHELFSDEAFSVNPVHTLVQYFLKMKLDSPIFYECLVYLMCVQQHNIEKEQVQYTDHISAQILMNLAETSGLLQVENKVVTLAHELLTVTLLKSAAALIDNFLPVLEMCDSDIFLQLLRPADGPPSDLYVEYMFDESTYSKSVIKMCADKLAKKYKTENITHPLMKIELVGKKV